MSSPTLWPERCTSLLEAAQSAECPKKADLVPLDNEELCELANVKQHGLLAYPYRPFDCSLSSQHLRWACPNLKLNRRAIRRATEYNGRSAIGFGEVPPKPTSQPRKAGIRSRQASDLISSRTPLFCHQHLQVAIAFPIHATYLTSPRALFLDKSDQVA